MTPEELDAAYAAIGEASRQYWLKHRGCPIVSGRDPLFAAPPGPCSYCGEDHLHKQAPEESE